MRNLSTSNLTMRGILSLILGGVLTFVPGLTINTVIIIVGATIILSSVYTMASNYFKKSSSFRGFWLYQGLLTLAIGLIFVIMPNTIVGVFITIIGIILLILGSLQLLGAINAISKHGWIWLFFLNAAIMIGGGLFMLSNPFETAEKILIVLGIIFLLYGCSQLFTAYRLSRKPKTYNGKVVEDVKFEEVK